MPCYSCGVRQTDPARGESQWRRGVFGEQQVLVCPACQQAGDWTVPLEHCLRCSSAHLIRRLGRVECLDCGNVREPGDATPAGRPAGRTGAGDPDLAEEVGRALDRLLRGAARPGIR